MTGEADILHPEQKFSIAGRDVTVHEFTFREELDIGPMVFDLISELDVIIGDGSDLSLLFDTLYRYPDVLESMLVLASGEEREWIINLSGKDGDELVKAFWIMNAPFFMRRFVARRMMLAAGKKLQKSIPNS